MWGVCVREVCVVVLEQMLQLYLDERQSKKKSKKKKRNHRPVKPAASAAGEKSGTMERPAVGKECDL